MTLTTYLKNNTSFFKHLSKSAKKIMSSISDWEIVVGALIMRHIGQLVCNGHAITAFYANPTEFLLNTKCNKTTPAPGRLHMFFKSVRLFTAIYPRISILNHSCEPNIGNR